MTTQPDPAGGDAPPRRPAEIAARIAAPMRHVDSFGAGPLADLRRLDPNGALAEPTLHRLLARHATEQEVGQTGFAAWALVLHAAALAAPDHLSVPRREDEPAEAEAQEQFWAERSRRARKRFGEALFKAGLSERRFAALLDATEDELRVALPRAVRFLVAKGERLPVLAVLDLVASARHLDDDRARSARHRIARGYYRAESDATKPKSTQSPASPGAAA
ncbi:type I-E CRISPR-associated protein Cse2/CasB [Methylobacterium currus]|uniref:type I-E CRISPR-associated protein Cse2/CasB n=1 Tax=Methylobacterium currus TaxID=2051553 RepID=UPI001E4EA06C|nr:type I-E CRISPR-associated protein Cse2/CasB [Methylobacterium currus]UHC14292.1 type I-E CRISPR-associated protein Cse2/CasB [Methylobacterium currus]